MESILLNELINKLFHGKLAKGYAKLIIEALRLKMAVLKAEGRLTMENLEAGIMVQKLTDIPQDAPNEIAESILLLFTQPDSIIPDDAKLTATQVQEIIFKYHGIRFPAVMVGKALRHIGYEPTSIMPSRVHGYRIMEKQQ